MMMRPIFALLLLFAALVAGTFPVVAQAVANPLAREFETLRTELVRDPQRGLLDSRAFEGRARRQLGADSDMVAAAQWLQAEAYLRIGAVTPASERIASALAIIRRVGRPTAVEGDVLRTRGDIAADGADPAGALEDYQAAYRVYGQTGDRRGQRMALMSIASLFREGADFEAALKYYGQALDIPGSDPMVAMSLLNNRGNVLTEMGRFDQAASQFRRALSIPGTGGNDDLKALIYRNLARAQSGAGKLPAAAASITAGLALLSPADTAGRRALEGVSARIALARGDTALAGRLIDRSFAGVDPTATSLAMRDNHRTAYSVYSAIGDKEAALRHLEALTRLDEQATRIATSTKTALLSARFDFQNQELRISRLREAELARNVADEQASARFQRILFACIAAAVAVLVGLMTFGIVTLRRSRDAVGLANVALEKALRAKGEFLATTSHEIRTPLNGILGMTQVMLVDPRLSPEVRDRLDIVHKAGTAMRSLVDDILDVAKMEAGNLSVERLPFDLIAVIEDVTRLFGRQAADRGLTFTLNTDGAPAWIEGDLVRFRQIVFNLLSNALKFTRQGAVGVRVDMLGERLRIAISDTGIGIAPDKVDDVFESFRQADTSTTREFGGTGLGLAICRNLARAMGGDILLHTTPGVGSTFTLDLPATLVPMPVSAEAASDRPDCGVLAVIERNPIARSMMRTWFAPRVGVVEFFEDVAAVVTRLARGGVTAVLVDVASLRQGSDAAEADFARIADAVLAAGVTGVAVTPADDAGFIYAKGMTLLAKPISGTKLVDALFDPGRKAASMPQTLVSDAA